jgi:serine/threonine protein kinase
LREAWVSSRVQSRFLGETFDPDRQRQSRLYTVMTYHPGETLEDRLHRPPKVSLGEGIAIAEKLVRAVTSLHRAGIIHRDIKPSNIILETGPGGSGLRLIDLGLARVLAIEEEDQPDARVPGTPSYMAPELFGTAKGDVESDIYAMGVTLYRMFTGGEFPYGENKSFSPPKSSLVPLARRRADLPAWLDAAIAKAVALDPDERFADAVELLLTLERGELYTPVPLNRPLYDRNPVLAWQLIACGLLAALVWAVAIR